MGSIEKRIGKRKVGDKIMGRQSDYGHGILKDLHELMHRVDHLERTLRRERLEHKEEVERLQARIAALEEENRLLRADNERMKRILSNDSSNSSLPPSSDQKTKAANTYNHRTKSDKTVGGQPGHKGKTLTKGEVRRKIEQGEIEHKVKNIGDTSTGKYVSKYELDIEFRVVATELRFYPDAKGQFHIPPQYHSDVVYGPGIKSLVVDLYSEGVVSNDRICELVRSITHGKVGLSEGSVYRFCQDFAKKSEPCLEDIDAELLNESVLTTDATHVTKDGKQVYIRNQSSKSAVLYSPMEKKNIETLKETGIIPDYVGTWVHDHETALYRFGCGHGECNVHLGRYLKKNTEETGNSWSERMAKHLWSVEEAKQARMAEGYDSFSAEYLESVEKGYREILAQGREENKQTKGNIARQEEKALLNRLETYRENHLLFAYNFSVPYSNNQSERDLRKCKNRQKMAGGFRKMSGMEMYCKILSVVETMKRKGMNIFNGIREIFQTGRSLFNRPSLNALNLG